MDTRRAVSKVRWPPTQQEFNMKLKAVVYSTLFCVACLCSDCTKNESNPVSPGNHISWTQFNNGFWDPHVSSIYVVSLFVDGQNLFAGTDSGVYLSTDEGAHWNPARSGLAEGFVRCFVSNGSDLFAGTDGGVYRTTNAGGLWTAINNGLPSGTVYALLYFNPILMAGTDFGIYNSTDDGVTWESASGGLPDWNEVFDLKAKGTTLFAGTLGGAFRSTDSGGSWTAIDSGFTGNYINVRSLAVNGQDLFAGLYGKGVYRSTDNGHSWNPVNTGLANYGVTTLLVAGSYLFAGTDGGVFLSLNNGANWFSVGPAEPNGGIQALAISGSFVFAGTGGINGGIWRCTLQ
jgi:photosystem II stability/assembly factor-like uncharacterized protein